MKIVPHWLALGASVLLAFVHALYWRGVMPERVPTHFGVSGEPNAWMSRDGAVATYIGAVCLTALIFAGITLLLPRIPVSMINMPHRTYWFAPERRAASVARLGSGLLVFTTATTLFLIAVFHLTFSASQMDHPRLPIAQAAPFLVAYLIATGVFVGWTIRSWRPPSADAPD